MRPLAVWMWVVAAPLLALTITMVSCGVSDKERFYGITDEDRTLAWKASRDQPPGPAATARAREAIVANHPEWDAEAQAAARAGEAMLGMSRAQAEVAWWGGCGFWREIRTVKYANRVRREGWWYDCALLFAAHYFVNDTLIAVRLYDETGRSIPMQPGPGGYGSTLPERSEPLRDSFECYQRAYLIYPGWRDPMSRRPTASDIP